MSMRLIQQFITALLALIIGLTAVLPVHAQVNVVSTIRPLQLIAGAVTDGISEPALLIQENQSYHHFNLRPSSMRALASADLVLWIGPELETWLADVIYQLPSRTQVIAAGSLADLTRHPFDSKVLLTDRDDNEHRPHGNGWDPHVWLDTGNARLIAREIEARLAALDADNAARYNDNLADFLAALDTFDGENSRRLMALADRSYAVYHNAFQYFERQYGLRHELVIVADDEMQPGMRHMLTVRNALQSLDLMCVMEDVTTNPATINTVIGNQSLRRVRADTLGHNLPSGAAGYLQLMGNLTQSFEQCLTD